MPTKYDDDGDYVPHSGKVHFKEFQPKRHNTRRKSAKKSTKKVKQEARDRMQKDEAKVAEEPLKRTMKATPKTKRTIGAVTQAATPPAKKQRVTPTRLKSLDVYMLGHILSFSMYSLNDVFSMLLLSHETYDKICQNQDFWEMVLNRLCEHPWTTMFGVIDVAQKSEHTERVELMLEYLNSDEYKGKLKEHIEEMRKQTPNADESEEKDEATQEQEDDEDDSENEEDDTTQRPIAPCMGLIKMLKQHQCCDCCMLSSTPSGKREKFNLHVGSDCDTAKSRRVPLLAWNGPRKISLCSTCCKMTLTKTSIGPLLCIPPDSVNLLPQKLQRNPYCRSAAPMRKHSLHSLALYATKYFPFSNDLKEKKEIRMERLRARRGWTAKRKIRRSG
mmetsp:Transcript_9917/g.36983  ORF Transcript_9917/g.36983 Transcript_9917/m.36983 type:complete len:388 (-) Transcript_9917:129-1292(-)